MFHGRSTFHGSLDMLVDDREAIIAELISRVRPQEAAKRRRVPGTPLDRWQATSTAARCSTPANLGAEGGRR